jgi:trimethylamine--corrinoid protein Co-methyltransferase
MRPRITFLSDELASRVIEEGFGLLLDPGIRIHNDEALRLLGEAGADVDRGSQIARIPEALAQASLESAPREFWLYGLDGRPVVHYGGDDVQFDPGSAAISVLDSQTQAQRPAKSEDFARFVRLVEMLPQIDAQSTAMICQDVVAEIGDLYRLYLALHFMRKPIVTGAFRKDTLATMLEMLEAVVGGSASLAEKPVAVFDVCPSPPLLWSDLTCQNLIDCARRMVPAELVSMPLAGATAPVTLAGAVVQHTAESLSGVVIGQLARRGSPIVWGGSPSIFDMRQGTTPMGDVGTWMIDCAYNEIGKRLGLPTHAYLGMTDAKIVDTQAGLESAGGVILAALAGVNMVSGAGMLDFESCQSPEKLVIDAEIIGMAKRLLAGIEGRETPIALALMRELGHRADYLGQEHTLRWFQKEFYIPSEVIDRGSLDGWKSRGGMNTFERARERTASLLQAYQPASLPSGLPAELRRIATLAAQRFGMESLPPFPLT